MEIKFTGNKTVEVTRLIFSMLDILGEVGIPLDGTPRRLEKMAMACMAVGDIKTSFMEVKSADANWFDMFTRLRLPGVRAVAGNALHSVVLIDGGCTASYWYGDLQYLKATH